MNTLNTIATLLSERVKNNSLADIHFTDNGSLRTFAKGLAAASFTGMDVNRTPKDIYAAVTEFANIVKDKSYSDVLSAFQRLSDAFAIRVGDSYKELSKIKDTVNELVARTASLAKSRINEDPVLASTESDLTTTTKLSPVRWDLLQDISEPVLLNHLFTKFDIKEDPTGNDSYINSLLVSRLPFATENNKVKLDEIKLTANKAKAMVDAVARRANGKITKEAVKRCMYHIFSIDEYKCRKAVSAIHRLSTGEDASSINDMIFLVYNYSNVLPYMSQEVLDTAASTQKIIDDRVSVMKDFIDVTAYLCSYYRNVAWRDAIVVPGMKINTDNWREFCAADKQIIKTNPTLAIMQYKNKIYGSDNIPAFGIAGSAIISKCDDIAKEAYAEASAHTLECNMKKKEIFRDAFIATGGRWLRGQKSYSYEYMYTNEPERYAASIFDSNREDAVENMYYSLILNSCYINTLTAKLHNRLRDEYKKITASAESITERDVANVDTKVLADVISEFLVDLVLK